MCLSHPQCPPKVPISPVPEWEANEELSRNSLSRCRDQKITLSCLNPGLRVGTCKKLSECEQQRGFPKGRVTEVTEKSPKESPQESGMFLKKTGDGKWKDCASFFPQNKHLSQLFFLLIKEISVHLKFILIKIPNIKFCPGCLWLSGLSACLQTKRLPV